MPDNESPLLQALKGNKAGPSLSSPEDLLTFILTHFDLTPKEQESSENEPMDVQTQESHVP